MAPRHRYGLFNIDDTLDDLTMRNANLSLDADDVNLAVSDSPSYGFGRHVKHLCQSYDFVIFLAGDATTKIRLLNTKTTKLNVA